MRAIGLTFFALGSAAPIFLIGESSLRGFGAVPVSGQELLDLDALVMGIIVTAVFLTPAYFLCFRIRSFRPKHQCLVSNTETVDRKMNPGS